MTRYEVWLADLPYHEDGCALIHGRRPVIIVSNDKANSSSNCVTVVPLTSNLNKHPLPTHVLIQGCGTRVDSLALCEQVMPIDKSWLVHSLGWVSYPHTQAALCRALSIHLGMAS